MENRYKIKEEYKHLSSFPNKTYVKVGKGMRRIADELTDGCLHYLLTDLRAECFGKVEERIKLLLNSSNGSDYLEKYEDEIITEQERILCEKAINGDTVDRKLIMDCMKDNINSNGDAFNLECKITDILYPKKPKTTEVPISDCGSETIGVYNNQLVNRWDEALCNTDKTYTKNQVIDLVNEWLEESKALIDLNSTESREVSFYNYINA